MASDAGASLSIRGDLRLMMIATVQCERCLVCCHVTDVFVNGVSEVHQRSETDADTSPAVLHCTPD